MSFGVLRLNICLNYGKIICIVFLASSTLAPRQPKQPRLDILPQKGDTIYNNHRITEYAILFGILL